MPSGAEYELRSNHSLLAVGIYRGDLDSAFRQIHGLEGARYGARQRFQIIRTHGWLDQSRRVYRHDIQRETRTGL